LNPGRNHPPSGIDFAQKDNTAHHPDAFAEDGTARSRKAMNDANFGGVAHIAPTFPGNRQLDADCSRFLSSFE
jgi:hypothetical protein